MKTAAVDPALYEPRLRARLAELEHRLHGIEHALEAEPNPDFSERATEREGDEVLESLGAAGVQEIRMIRAALERIDEGEFGYCVNCGNPIPAARLDIVPHAPRCAKCA
ncbi:MAG: TraR/DksA family transcriptional regulator [Rubrimonas sp.]|uniref:TraR/DksA family transcriptional regulator n=1 Tax=Rubrimonas sp. TaxID=2036015 RepID=UPI002FDCB577